MALQPGTILENRYHREYEVFSASNPCSARAAWAPSAAARAEAEKVLGKLEG